MPAIRPTLAAARTPLSQKTGATTPHAAGHVAPTREGRPPYDARSLRGGRDPPFRATVGGGGEARVCPRRRHPATAVPRHARSRPRCRQARSTARTDRSEGAVRQAGGPHPPDVATRPVGPPSSCPWSLRQHRSLGGSPPGCSESHAPAGDSVGRPSRAVSLGRAAARRLAAPPRTRRRCRLRRDELVSPQCGRRHGLPLDPRLSPPQERHRDRVRRAR